MAKRRRITKEQYEKVAYLARRCIPKRIIAQACGYTESGFYKRLKKDAKLREVIESNFAEGEIGISVSQYNQAMNHYQTICKDCGKISEGGFYESCPLCDKLEPELAGQHTNVKHRFIQADTAMLIHLGKHILGQTDRALIEIHGNKDQPLVDKNLSKEQIDRKLAALLPFLNEQYGTKEKELDHADLLVDIKKCA